jgi:alpha-glucosidase (family GH31 glycosyl hydrolase)
MHIDPSPSRTFSTRVMTQLIHHPEGDHNPYDPAPWSRRPLHPEVGEKVTVGVKAEATLDGVLVEWESNGEQERRLLDRDGEVWSGEIGPFSHDAGYRFIAGGITTDWHRIRPWHSDTYRFSGIRQLDDTIEAVCGPTVLFLRPNGRRLSWTLQARDRALGENAVDNGGWGVSIKDGALHLVSEHGQLSIAEITVASLTDGTVTSVGLSWHLADNEGLFGTGERYDSLDLRGKTPDVRVYEQYKQQSSRTYFPLPWVLSSRGYGLKVDSNERIRFDLGNYRDDIATATIPGETAQGDLFFGSPKEVLGEYTATVGRPHPLPLWAYGPWMSSNEWDRDSVVREMVDRTISEEIPATVLVIEAWSDEATYYLFNDTEYQPVPGDTAVKPEDMKHASRPDPQGLIDWLHDNDLRVILWQIPALKDHTGNPQQEHDITHAEHSGLCVSTTEGGIYRNRGWWFPHSPIIDFTNPEAVGWWFKKRAYLVSEYGVDGFKTDGGEHLWGSDVINHAGETGHAAANTYPTHYLRTYHQFLTGHGHTQPVTFSRAGFTGAQAHPAHWAGDEDSTWDAYRASLTAGLSAALGGIAFWSWDLGGFSGPLPSAELYMRSTAMAAFSPIMQYHSEHNDHRRPLIDRTPWNVAEQTGEPRVLDTYRFYAKLRMNLIPYLDTLGHIASRDGTPIIRPLLVEYPDDPEAVAVDDQYLLGAGLLVAPVLEEGATSRQVYVPDGVWYDLWTGTPIPSGWIEAETPLDRIPVYVRGGAAIPMWFKDEPEFGSDVGLPAPDSGHLVAVVYPGTGTAEFRHPLTGATIRVAVRIDHGELVVELDSTTPIDMWLPAATQPGITGRVSRDDPMRLELG